MYSLFFSLNLFCSSPPYCSRADQLFNKNRRCAVCFVDFVFSPVRSLSIEIIAISFLRRPHRTTTVCPRPTVGEASIIFDTGFIILFFCTYIFFSSVRIIYIYRIIIVFRISFPFLRGGRVRPSCCCAKSRRNRNFINVILRWIYVVISVGTYTLRFCAPPPPPTHNGCAPPLILCNTLRRQKSEFFRTAKDENEHGQ